MSPSAGTDQDRAPSILFIYGLYDPCIQFLKTIMNYGSDTMVSLSTTAVRGRPSGCRHTM